MPKVRISPVFCWKEPPEFVEARIRREPLSSSPRGDHAIAVGAVVLVAGAWLAAGGSPDTPWWMGFLVGLAAAGVFGYLVPSYYRRQQERARARSDIILTQEGLFRRGIFGCSAAYSAIEFAVIVAEKVGDHEVPILAVRRRTGQWIELGIAPHISVDDLRMFLAAKAPLRQDVPATGRELRIVATPLWDLYAASLLLGLAIAVAWAAAGDWWSLRTRGAREVAVERAVSGLAPAGTAPEAYLLARKSAGAVLGRQMLLRVILAGTLLAAACVLWWLVFHLRRMVKSLEARCIGLAEVVERRARFVSGAKPAAPPDPPPDAPQAPGAPDVSPVPPVPPI